MMRGKLSETSDIGGKIESMFETQTVQICVGKRQTNGICQQKQSSVFGAAASPANTSSSSLVFMKKKKSPTLLWHSGSWKLLLQDST